MYRNINSRFGHDRAQSNEPKSARAVSIVAKECKGCKHSFGKKSRKIITKAVY